MLSQFFARMLDTMILRYNDAKLKIFGSKDRTDELLFQKKSPFHDERSFERVFFVHICSHWKNF